MSFQLGDHIVAKVKLRSGDGWGIKPEAKQLDGGVYIFSFGWLIDEEDNSLYVGEVAWLPDRKRWPADAPVWVAEGDLLDIAKLS